MPFFAFLTRALRVESRSLMAALLRLFVGLAVILAIYSAQDEFRFLGAPGLVLFSWLTWIGFLLVLACGMLYFSSAIAEEREERSLSLLRITRLNPLAIFTGKFVARLVAATQLIITPFPFVLLCRTLGGVEWMQILPAFVTLLICFFVAASIGMFCSTIASSMGRALAHTVSLLGMWLGWPLVVVVLGTFLMRGTSEAQFSQDWPWLYSAGQACLYSSPFVRLSDLTFGGATGLTAGPFIWFSLAIGGGFLGLAALNFGTRPYDRVTVARKAGPGRSTRRRRARVRGLAIAWKDATFVFRNREYIFWRVPVYAVTIGGFYLLLDALGGMPRWNEWLLGWSVIAAMVELTVFSLRVLSHEVGTGTLSTLHSLPRTTGSLCMEKLVTIWKPLLLPAVLFTWSALLDPGDALDFVGELLTNDEGILGIAACLCGWHLVAWLSLRIRHWALLAAPALMLFSMIFLSLLFRDDGAVATVLFFLAVPALQVLCVTRLSALAAR